MIYFKQEDITMNNEEREKWIDDDFWMDSIKDALGDMSMKITPIRGEYGKEVKLELKDPGVYAIALLKDIT